MLDFWGVCLGGYGRKLSKTIQFFPGYILHDTMIHECIIFMCVDLVPVAKIAKRTGGRTSELIQYPEQSKGSLQTSHFCCAYTDFLQIFQSLSQQLQKPMAVFQTLP